MFIVETMGVLCPLFYENVVVQSIVFGALFYARESMGKQQARCLLFIYIYLPLLKMML